MTRRIGTTGHPSRIKTAKGLLSRSLERRAKAGKKLEMTRILCAHVIVALQLTRGQHRGPMATLKRRRASMATTVASTETKTKATATATPAVLTVATVATATAVMPTAATTTKATAGTAMTASTVAHAADVVVAETTVAIVAGPAAVATAGIVAMAAAGTKAAEAVLPGDAAIAVVKTVAGKSDAVKTAATAARGAQIAGMTAEGMDGTVKVLSTAVAWDVATVMMRATGARREVVATGGPAARTATLVEATGSLAKGGMSLGVAVAFPNQQGNVVSSHESPHRLLRLCHVVVPTWKTGGGTVPGRPIGLQRLIFWTEGGLPAGQPMLFWTRLGKYQGNRGTRRHRKRSGSAWNEKSRE